MTAAKRAVKWDPVLRGALQGQAGPNAVAEHYPAFCAERAAEDRPLPAYVQQEFEAYLKCGRLEHGFLRVRCEGCHAEKLVAFSCKRRGCVTRLYGARKGRQGGPGLRRGVMLIERGG